MTLDSGLRRNDGKLRNDGKIKQSLLGWYLIPAQRSPDLPPERGNRMLELVTVSDADFEQWLRAESRAHGNRLDHDPEALRPHFDLARTIAVYDGNDIVGGANSHRLEMSVPGGSAIVAGVSNVAVQPTHRRRGIMSMMMRHQIDDVHQRGEPLAALFATESAIYGRFGYGVGSFHEYWTIERPHTAYANPNSYAGQITFIDPGDIGAQLPEVFRRSTANRPGVFQRAPHQWEWDAQSPEHQQGGRGGLFYAAYQNAAGNIDGYAAYRTSGSGSLTVNELMAVNGAAAAALWRFCFDTDLVSTIQAVKRPVDDPLPWLLADPRRLQRSTRDGLWLRIVDLAAALPLRRYSAADRLVLEVRDALCQWNNARFELETDTAETAVCRRTDAAPDLTIAVSALATVFLGAAGFTELAPAGLVEEHTPGAARRADRMFAVPLRPWTPHNF